MASHRRFSDGCSLREVQIPFRSSLSAAGKGSVGCWKGLSRPHPAPVEDLPWSYQGGAKSDDRMCIRLAPCLSLAVYSPHFHQERPRDRPVDVVATGSPIGTKGANSCSKRDRDRWEGLPEPGSVQTLPLHLARVFSFQGEMEGDIIRRDDDPQRVKALSGIRSLGIRGAAVRAIKAVRE